jgi:hypothetical protein
MLYSHAHGVFVLAAQNFFYLLQWKNLRSMTLGWIICQTLILTAFFPYFYPKIFGGNSVNNAITFQIGQGSAPSLLDPCRSVYRLLLSARRERSWEQIRASYSAAGIFLLAGVWISAIRGGCKKWVTAAARLSLSPKRFFYGKNKLLLIGCWLVFPILLPFIVSILIAPIYADRYTISAAPALYLLVAVAILRIRKLVPWVVSLGALTILIVPGLSYYYSTAINEQWREAARYVEENSRPDEVIVFAPNMSMAIQQRTFDWYYQGNLSGCGLDSRLGDSQAISEALSHCLSSHDRFWVILPDYPTESSDEPYRSFFLSPEQTEVHKLKEEKFVVLAVYLFELQKDNQ